MRRLLPFLAAMLMSVMFWSGNAAQAAEAFGCIEVSEAAAGHFEGDSDQVPGDAEKGAMHHHGGCHGHYSAISDEDGPPALHDVLAVALGGTSLLVPHGADPGLTLRPPIA